MKTSESIKELMTAIQAVQQNVGTIEKASTGQVGSRSYKYNGLRETWDAVRPLLATNKLVITQSPTTGDANMGMFFSTTIYHIESEQWMSEIMQMSLTKDDPQGIGAGITYYRRYMMMSMLGLIPDDDSDAKEHRLATAQQKQQIVGAVKLLYPELTKPEDIVKTIMNIVGKYPGNIREDEANDALALIKAFGARGDESNT